MVRTILCRPVSEPKVFSDDYEPTACCCTPNGLILVASSLGNIHVYLASEKSNNRSIYKFQIGGVAKKIVHCNYGGYITTLESKLTDYHSGVSHEGLFHQARVYLNWTTQPLDARYLMQHRTGYTKEMLQPDLYAGKFLVIDVPIKYSVTDIACCDTNGNIALSTEAKVFLYSHKQIALSGSQDSPFVVDFELVLEIDAGFQINHVALYENYIAFASCSEIRAIQISSERKESICQAEDVTESIDITQPSTSPPAGEIKDCELCQSKADENFVMWNIEQGCSHGLEGLEHEAFAVSKRKMTSASHNTPTPTYIIEKSIVKFDSVVQDTVYTDHGKTAKEIVGPKEAITGHPLMVVNSNVPRMVTLGQQLPSSEISHVTMLFRRFANSQLDSSLDPACIHSLQWMPIYMQNSLSSTTTATDNCKTPIMVSLGFFFSTARKGYLYDMLNTPVLLSEYDFTEDCVSACLTHEMLYVITKNGLETYTTRLYPSAAKTAVALSKEFQSPPHNHAEASPRYHAEAMDRERTWSSLSFSSGSEVDCKSQAGDSHKDFSEEENTETQGSEEMILSEGHYTKVPVEPRVGVLKKSASRLSFRRRKKNAKEKKENKVQSDLERSQEIVLGMEKIASYVSSENKIQYSSIYESLDLVKPCPPTDIEICLIGMYSLRGFAFIGSCDKFAVLLQRGSEHKGKRGSLVKDRVLPWNVYVLEKVPAREICKEIVNLIEGSEFANPGVFYQLLSEAHICLRVALTSYVPDDDKEAIRTSIRKSAVMLGDFFSRCKTNLKCSNAEDYYKMAGIKLGQVLSRHAKRDKEDQTGHKYGSGIINYLNERIFDDHDEAAELLSEELVVFVLKIYSIAAPELLSKVILKSRLNITTPEDAVSILETFMTKESKTAEYKLTSLDLVTLAILRLQLGDLTQTELILKRISSDQLIETLSVYPGIIWEGDNLTHLGQLLRRHFSLTFSDLMVQFHDKGLLTVETALGLFGLSKTDSNSETQPSLKACAFLEALLNEKKREMNFTEIMDHLIELYLSWFKSRPQVVLLKIPHLHIPKGGGHFAPRYEWLDKLPPFAGEKPLPQDCLLRKQHQLSRSNQSTPDSSPKDRISSTKSLDIVHKCTCCCCNSILLKLQSLLSSPMCSYSTCSKIIEFCKENYFSGEDSLKLLCYPVIGKSHEAVEFVVKHYPSIMLQYAKDVFHNRKDEWKILLDCLLKTLNESLYEEWNKDTYMDALRGTLLKLARLCKPRDFVELIPKQGTARFFVPFVHECYQIHNSISLRRNILRVYEPATA